MATVYLKGETRLRNPGFIALLLLMSGLLVYHIVAISIVRPSLLDACVTAIIALGLGMGWYALFSSRLKVKFDSKHLKLRTRGLIGRRLKLRTRDMVSCSVVDVPPSARWSGSLAHPTSDLTCFDFGGSKGLCIRMRDGRSFFVSSDDLFARRRDIPFPTSAAAS